MFRLFALILVYCLSANVFSHNIIPTKSSLDCNMSQQCIQTAISDIVPIITLKRQVLGGSLSSRVNFTVIKKPIHAQLIPTSIAILLLAIGLALIFFDDHLKKSKKRKK